MSWKFNLYTIPEITSAILMMLLALYVLIRRKGSGAKVYALILIGLSLWSLGHAQELTSNSSTEEDIWTIVKFAGMATVPGAWFAFSLQYSGREKYLSYLTIPILVLEPVFALIGLGFHTFTDSILNLGPLNRRGIFIPILNANIWGDQLHMGYTYTLLVISTFLSIHFIFQVKKPFRGQMITLLIGILSPWIGNFISSDIIVWNLQDPTPFAFHISVIALVYSLFLYRIVDLTPIPRGKLFESIDDGIIVIDTENRIIDLNTHATHILDKKFSQVIGNKIDQILPIRKNILESTNKGDKEKIQINLEGSKGTFNVLVSPYQNGKLKAKGQIVFFQEDIDQNKTTQLTSDIETKYKTIFESTDDAMILSTLDGMIIECNRSVCKIFGYSQGELLGMSLSEVIDTQSDLSTSDVITHVRRNGFTIFECIGKGKFGSLFPVEIRTRIVSIGDQQLIFTQIKDISSHQRLEKALEESLDKIHAFYNISHASLTIEHLPDMLQTVADSIAIALPTDKVTITILDHEQEKIKHYIRGGENPGRIPFVSLEELKQGLTGWVIKEKKPALSPKGKPDPRESPRVQKRRVETNSGAVLVVPMINKDSVIGTIMAVNRPDQANFGQHDSELMMAIANQVAISIENASLYEEAQRRIQESETLRNTSTVVTATLQQDETVERILEQLGNVVSYDSASVQLLGDGYLEIVGGRGWSNPKAVLGIRFPIPADNPNTKVIQKRRPHILGDASSAHHSFLQEPHSHINSWLGVPLIADNQVIGMLTLDSVQPHYYTEQHARQASAFADQVAIALKNARLFEAEQSRSREAETLRRAGAAVAATLDQSEAIEKILVQLEMVVPYDSASVQLLQNGQLEVVGGRGWSESDPMVGMRYPVPADNPNTQVIQGRKSVIINDTHHEYSHFRQSKLSGHIRSWLGAPLMIQEQIIGMLAVHKKEPCFYKPNHARLIMAFADHVAVASENARLFAEVQMMAITDSLTGIYNRRGLFELGQREVDRAYRFNRPLAAIMLDIDYFKQINDTYSHAIGDQVLKELATRCRKHLRDLDILGRYGGEEFAILLPETDMQSAYLVAERLRKTMLEDPVQTDRGPITVTISLGVTAATQESPYLTILLDRADTATYAAKQAGRNQVAVR